MALEQLRYQVTLDGTTHDCVQVIWADQLLGEREAHRHGITDKMGLHMTTYWCWAALARMGAGVGEFQAFLTNPTLDIIPLEALKVDPTAPAVPAG